MTLQSRDHRFSLDCSSFWAVLQRTVWNVFYSLVRSAVVVEIYEVFYYFVQMLFIKNNQKMVQTFLSNGTYPSFCIRIHIRGIRNNANIVYAILTVRKPFQFRGIIVNEIRIWIIGWKIIPF